MKIKPLIFMITFSSILAGCGSNSDGPSGSTIAPHPTKTPHPASAATTNDISYS